MFFSKLHLRINKLDLAKLCYERAITTLCRDNVIENFFVPYTKFEDEEKKNDEFSLRLVVPR